MLNGLLNARARGEGDRNKLAAKRLLPAMFASL